MTKMYCRFLRTNSDGSYSADVLWDGRLVRNLPERVPYEVLQAAIREATGISIPDCEQMVFRPLEYPKGFFRYFAYFNNIFPGEEDQRIDLSRLEQAMGGFKKEEGAELRNTIAYIAIDEMRERGEIKGLEVAFREDTRTNTIQYSLPQLG